MKKKKTKMKNREKIIIHLSFQCQHHLLEHEQQVGAKSLLSQSLIPFPLQKVNNFFQFLGYFRLDYVPASVVDVDVVA